MVKKGRWLVSLTGVNSI